MMSLEEFAKLSHDEQKKVSIDSLNEMITRFNSENESNLIKKFRYSRNSSVFRAITLIIIQILIMLLIFDKSIIIALFATLVIQGSIILSDDIDKSFLYVEIADYVIDKHRFINNVMLLLSDSVTNTDKKTL